MIQLSTERAESQEISTTTISCDGTSVCRLDEIVLELLERKLSLTPPERSNFAVPLKIYTASIDSLEITGLAFIIWLLQSES